MEHNSSHWHQWWCSIPPTDITMETIFPTNTNDGLLFYYDRHKGIFYSNWPQSSPLMSKLVLYLERWHTPDLNHRVNRLLLEASSSAVLGSFCSSVYCPPEKGSMVNHFSEDCEKRFSGFFLFFAYFYCQTSVLHWLTVVLGPHWLT